MFRWRKPERMGSSSPARSKATTRAGRRLSSLKVFKARPGPRMSPVVFMRVISARLSRERSVVPTTRGRRWPTGVLAPTK